MAGLKMAKADKQDINKLTDFLMALEEVSENGFKLSEWECGTEASHYDMYQVLKQIVSNVDGCDRLDGEKVEFYFNFNVAHHWRRVTMGCAILIDNCCDPALDHLEFKPELLAPAAALKEILASQDVADFILERLGEKVLNAATLAIAEEASESDNSQPTTVNT